MAETTYSYSISADITAGDVEGNQLLLQVNAAAIAADCKEVNTNGDDLDVVMLDALSPGDETILDGVVADHVVTPIVDPGFGAEFAYVESWSESTTNSLTYQQKVRLSVTIVEGGDYLLAWNFTWTHASTSKPAQFQIEQDDTTQIWFAEQIANSSTFEHRQPMGGFRKVTLAPGSYTFDLDYRRKSNPSTTVRIDEAALSLFKVAA